MKSVVQEELPEQLSLADLQVILQGGDTSKIPNNKPIPNDLNVNPRSVDPPLYTYHLSRPMHRVRLQHP